MPSKLPQVTGRDAIKAFEAAGYYEDRTCGSHHILKHPEKAYLLSIPVHDGKTLGHGLLRSQIWIAEMTVEQFMEFLRT